MEKREVSLTEGLKAIYNEADKQGAFNPVKEKLFNKARINKDNSAKTETNVSPEINNSSVVPSRNDKKNIDFSAGGFKPNLTDIANYNPNVNIAANLGGNEGFYADAGAGASLQGGVDYDAVAGYKGKNVDAKVDTKGFEISKGFGNEKNNVNINLAKRFDGDTNVNIEGKKQLNKYIDLKGFARSDGDYGASVGFDFKF